MTNSMTITMTTAISSGSGMPAGVAPANDWSAPVVWVGVPCEMPRSIPYRTALMPSVCTIGVIPTNVTSSPLTSPAARQIA